MDDIDGPDRTGEVAEIIKMPPAWRGLKSSAPQAQVDAYWHALRGGRLVPARSDVDPRGIEGALSHAFIAERIAPGHARLRIAGNHVGDLLGMEVRGMPMSALFEPEARPTLQNALRTVFTGPAVCKLLLQSRPRIGKPALHAEMSLYPLRDDQGEITRVMGCLTTEGNIGRAPRRFEINASKRKTLELNVTGIRATQQPEPMGMAEAQEVFAHSSVPYLRLVTDNT